MFRVASWQVYRKGRKGLQLKVYGRECMLGIFECHRQCSISSSGYMGVSVQFSSVAQSYPTLQPHEPQHTRPPCPSPTPGVHPNSCPSSQWCHPAISSSVIPCSSCLQSFPASGSFQMSQLFDSGGQNKFQLQHQSFQWTPRTDLL